MGAAAAVTAHSDDARYGPDAHAFDPFRFARLRERGAGAGARQEVSLAWTFRGRSERRGGACGRTLRTES